MTRWLCRCTNLDNAFIVMTEAPYRRRRGRRRMLVCVCAHFAFQSAKCKLASATDVPSETRPGPAKTPGRTRRRRRTSHPRLAYVSSAHTTVYSGETHTHARVPPTR
eukprot:5833807-Prymnesium_polylepis.2